MIIKSMSRKEPSFGQLTTYMTDEKSDRDYDLHHNLFSRDPEAIAQEFERNSQLLAKRRNGNYLYHEILSIDTRRIGQNRNVKEALRMLALGYVEQRCARNMVYGAMHQDHDGHLHYHLMISANERDDRKRLRLPKAKFDLAKRETEKLALSQFPELEQSEVMTAPLAEKVERREQRDSRKATEVKKRGGRLSQRDQLAQEIRAMMAYANSQVEFERLLAGKGFEFYTRGKHHGVRALEIAEGAKKPKVHRFATLGVADDYAAFLGLVEPLVEAVDEKDQREGEKEKQTGAQEDLGAGERETSDEIDGESDNETYVKRGSDTDLSFDPGSQQNPHDRYAPQDAFVDEMAQRRAKREAQERSRTQTEGPRRR
jgi:hypothetical protein